MRRTRTLSLPDHLDDKVEEQVIKKGGEFSPLIQRLLESYFESAAASTDIDVSALIKRAKKYSARKATGIDFEDDLTNLLTTAGYKVEHNPKLPGALMRPDFFVKKEGAKECEGGYIISKSVGSQDRLMLALGESLLVKAATHRPVVVVVPYFIDASEVPVVKAYRQSGIGLAVPGRLVHDIEQACGCRVAGSRVAG